MFSLKPKRKSMTAFEALNEFEKDKEFVARRAAREEEFKRLKEIYDLDEKELVEELNALGCNVESVWNLVNRQYDYPQAIPVLIKHLRVKHHPKISAGIVRSLAVVKLKDNDELWRLLVDLYQKTLPSKLISVPCERGLQEAIALALKYNATRDRIPDLQMLIEKCPEGDALSWLKEAIIKQEKDSSRREKKTWPPSVSAAPGEWLSKDEIANCLRPEFMKQEQTVDYSIEFDLRFLKEFLAELNCKAPTVFWPDTKIVKSVFKNLVRDEIGGMKLKRKGEVSDKDSIWLLIWHIDFDAVKLTFHSADKKIVSAIEAVCNSLIDRKNI